MSEFHYPNFKNGESTVNKTFATCSALLVLGSMTVLAQDSKSGIIHINGGATTVAIGHSPATECEGIEPAAILFMTTSVPVVISNMLVMLFATASAACGGEWTPANQITSLKTGTTKKISLGLGFVHGTNRSLVILTGGLQEHAMHQSGWRSPGEAPMWRER